MQGVLLKYEEVGDPSMASQHQHGKAARGDQGAGVGFVRYNKTNMTSQHVLSAVNLLT